jgi:UDP:flavonoid glycosyltransferase YjiC (YdhE family)
MRNKKILIFPFNLLSHYLRCIVLAAEYKEYEVLFAYSKEYEAFVKKAGYKMFDVENFDAIEVVALASKFNFSWLNKKNSERIFLSQVKIIGEHQPDFVIGDASPTLKMAAEYAGVKYVALMNAYMSKYYDGYRALSRTHFMYNYLNALPDSLSVLITKAAEKISFKIVHRSFKRLRKKYQLKYVSDYLSEQEGDENLICDSTDLFPLKRLPANYKQVGSLLYLFDEREDSFLDTLDKNKPTICICLGSSGNSTALNFLSSKEYEKYNIIIVGEQNISMLSKHLYYKRFVNLDEILPRCLFLICHGGNGTVYMALKHHIYMLCLTNHFEQEWNVHQLEKNNFGISINENTKEKIDKQFEKVG